VGRSVALFATVTLIPAGLLGLGGVYGVGWFGLAVLYLSLFAFVVDEMAGFAAPGAATRGHTDGLLVVLAVVHFGLLALAVWVVSGGSGLGFASRVLAFFAFGLFFGQVSNSVAHELIHRGRAPLYRLGMWVFISHLFGHHASAHRLVHHRFVATGRDPNSAPLGMGFYRFAPRAWVGSFKQGFWAERQRPGVHPYVWYIAGALGMLGLAALIGGVDGVTAYVALASYATMQLLLSDYVQHYGLVRETAAGGGYEPVAARHSWNGRQRFSGLLMLNAPRHSDHHGHPGREFPALALEAGCPMLPHSLAVMGVIALLPRRWRRVMDGRVAALVEGNVTG